MSRLCGAVLASAVALGGVVSSESAEAAEPDCGNVVFADRFAESTTSNWSQPGNVEGNGSISIVPDPLDPASRAAQFMVPNDGVSFRAEVAQRHPEFARYRYAFSQFIPSDWTPYRYETIVAQWHGSALNGYNLNPPVALAIRGTNPAWTVRVYDVADPNSAPPTMTDTRYFPDAAVEYDTWNNWVFDITWSTPASDGLLIVSLNGREVLRVAGVNNYHQKNAPYFKTGIYRSTWRSHTPGANDVELFVKDVSITEASGCDSVQPVAVGAAITESAAAPNVDSPDAVQAAEVVGVQPAEFSEEVAPPALPTASASSTPTPEAVPAVQATELASTGIETIPMLGMATAVLLAGVVVFCRRRRFSGH